MSGELWVNDARIVAWKEEGNALIIALEDYLFKREVQQEVGIEDFNEKFDLSEEASNDHVPREWGDASKVNKLKPCIQTKSFLTGSGGRRVGQQQS